MSLNRENQYLKIKTTKKKKYIVIQIISVKHICQKWFANRKPENIWKIGKLNMLIVCAYYGAFCLSLHNIVPHQWSLSDWVTGKLPVECRLCIQGTLVCVITVDIIILLHERSVSAALAGRLWWPLLTAFFRFLYLSLFLSPPITFLS